MSDTDRQKLTDELAALVAARAWFRHVGDTGCRGDVWASLRAGMIAEERWHGRRVREPVALRWVRAVEGHALRTADAAAILAAVEHSGGWAAWGEPHSIATDRGTSTGARGRACAVRALVRHGVITQAEADGIAGP